MTLVWPNYMKIGVSRTIAAILNDITSEIRSCEVTWPEVMSFKMAAICGLANPFSLYLIPLFYHLELIMTKALSTVVTCVSIRTQIVCHITHGLLGRFLHIICPICHMRDHLPSDFSTIISKMSLTATLDKKPICFLSHSYEPLWPSYLRFWVCNAAVILCCWFKCGLCC